MKEVGASRSLGVGALVLGLAGAAVAVLVDGSKIAAAELLPPPLELGGPGCSVAADDARARASGAERAALARIARYPFDVVDGVEATRLLHEAANCALAGGDPAESARLAALEGQWNARLQADYRARIVRVRVLLDRDRSAVALREVTELGRMLRRSRGDYVNWLGREQRRLERGGSGP